MAQYINKDALVAEIEKRRNANAFTEGAFEEDIDILSFINTLEVKEVDLEEELSMLDRTLFDLDGVAVKGTTHYLTVEDVKDIAKHYFELGLNVNQKGG